MPPLLASFPVERVKQVFAAHGIHVLEEYPDGQIIFGDAPPSEKYKGRFFPGHAHVPGRYSIYTVRALLERLVTSPAEREAMENELFNYSSEGLGLEGTEEPV
jgi:hypothetical protein